MSDSSTTRRFYTATEAYREVLRWEEIARTSDAEKLKTLRAEAIHGSLDEAKAEYERFTSGVRFDYAITHQAEVEPELDREEPDGD